LEFIHSLVFLGMMQGREIHRSQSRDKDTVYGISSGEAFCWFEHNCWKVTCEEGRNIGRTLWQAFLDLGGPRPSEYRVRAGAELSLRPAPSPMFVRQGVRCLQHWTIAENRERGTWL